MRERRYDLDWLRVISMLGVFVLHCTRFFCNEDWHVKAPVAQQSEFWALGRGVLLWVWLMEMFFLVSGFATWYSLRRRTAGQYLLERVKRILIPLYIVGLLILIPPQKYLEDLTHGRITGSFWHWLPSYYLGLPRGLLSRPYLADPVELLPYTFSGHLWFIQLLFLISLVALPLILFLRSTAGLRLIDRLAGWCARRGGIFLLVIPLAAVRVGLMWIPITADRTWPQFIWYLVYFLIGYLIAADVRFTEGIKRAGWIGLALWAVLFPVLGSLMDLVLGLPISEYEGFTLTFAIWQIAYSFISLGAVIFLVSMAAKHLNSTNGFLRYANEAVLPFYLFHQTVILIVGWYVLRWGMGVLAEFAVIALISFPLTVLLYEVFVRRIGFMRFLFGMAPRKREPTQVS